VKRCLFSIIALVLATTSLLLADPKWDPSIDAFEKQDQTTPPPKDAVLFVGSSSIRLWKTLAEDFPGVPVLNRGFGGSTIPAVNEYVERIVWPYAPLLIVFYAGDNDIANKATPEKVLKDYQAFVAKVREKLPETPIIFLSIKPSPSRAALLPAQQEANRLIRDYIATDKSQTFVDVATPLLGQDGQPNGKLFVEDGIHMTPDAYTLWRDILRPYVEPAAQ
jgi:lysophospholipase L1-like esterase